MTVPVNVNLTHRLAYNSQGEAIRLACAIGNLPLQDIRISREQFATLKATGKLAYGQIPVLEITEDHKKSIIAQSGAIMRYIGKYSGLYPKDHDLQAATIDSLIDHVNDLTSALHMTKFPGNAIVSCQYSVQLLN